MSLAVRVGRSLYKLSDISYMQSNYRNCLFISSQSWIYNCSQKGFIQLFQFNAGYQTIGEEYVNIIQVDKTQRRVPSALVSTLTSSLLNLNTNRWHFQNTFLNNSFLSFKGTIDSSIKPYFSDENRKMFHT